MTHLIFVRCAGILASLFFWVPQSSADSPGALAPQNQVQSPLEITQVDVFAVKNWNSTQVSILGFMLGMERRETLTVALRNGLRLDDDFGQACLKERMCNVFNGANYNGVSLIFDESEVLEKIKILVRQRNVSSKERSVWLVSKFQGVTRQFAESYSDNLRIRTLGFADAILAGKMTTPSIWGANSSGAWLGAHREYQYSRLGLILDVDLHDPGFSSDSTVDKLTFEFVRPGTSS